MALANMVKGATRPTQTITWTQEDGTAFILTGATITGVMLNKSTKVSRAIAGTLAVTDGANGVFTWAYHADDVAESGHFLVQFTATYVAVPTVAKTRYALFVVE